jgi:hypothetical protein
MTNQEIEARKEEIYQARLKLDEEMRSLDGEEAKNRFGARYPIGSTQEDGYGKNL